MATMLSSAVLAGGLNASGASAVAAVYSLILANIKLIVFVIKIHICKFQLFRRNTPTSITQKFMLNIQTLTCQIMDYVIKFFYFFK
jgi:hypothetical protein